MQKFTIAMVAVGFALTACGGDDAAQKKDEPAAAAKAEEPKEEAPAEPAVDLAKYDTAGTITEATSAGGKAGLKMSALTADGAFAACGLQDNDIVVAIDGAAVAAGRAGANALKMACEKGQAVTVDRGGAEVPAK
jgi:type II secretory pathway component PulC